MFAQNFIPISEAMSARQGHHVILFDEKRWDTESLEVVW